MSQLLMASADGQPGLAHVTSAIQHINGCDGPLLFLELVPQEKIDRVSHLSVIVVVTVHCSSCLVRLVLC